MPNVDDRFFTAHFPGSARVCGRVLVDFTPYHYLLLKAIQSPLMDRNGINTPSDLLVAVAACRNIFGKPVNLKASVRDLLWRARMNRNPDLFKREMIKFSAWMSAHSIGPRFWEIVTGGPRTRDLSGPDIMTLIVPIIMKTNIAEADAWNMSLGRLQWINAEIQEIEGSDRRFLYDDDLTETEAGNA